jgi:hypothetical protein
MKARGPSFLTALTLFEGKKLQEKGSEPKEDDGLWKLSERKEREKCNKQILIDQRKEECKRIKSIDQIVKIEKKAKENENRHQIPKNVSTIDSSGTSSLSRRNIIGFGDGDNGRNNGDSGGGGGSFFSALSLFSQHVENTKERHQREFILKESKSSERDEKQRNERVLKEKEEEVKLSKERLLIRREQRDRFLRKQREQREQRKQRQEQRERAEQEQQHRQEQERREIRQREVALSRQRERERLLTENVTRMIPKAKETTSNNTREREEDVTDPGLLSLMTPSLSEKPTLPFVPFVPTEQGREGKRKKLLTLRRLVLRCVRENINKYPEIVQLDSFNLMCCNFF